MHHIRQVLLLVNWVEGMMKLTLSLRATPCPSPPPMQTLKVRQPPCLIASTASHCIV